MEFPRLNKPPIVEAVFSIEVERETASAVDYEKLKESMQDGEWKEKFSLESRIKFDPAKATAEQEGSTRTALGYALHSPTADNPSEVLDFEFGRFSYHRMPGYEAFEDCLARVSEYWSRYVEAFAPKSVASVSLRFLNSIRIPSLKFEYDDYFETLLPVSPKWDQMVESTNALRTEMNLSLHGDVGARLVTVLRQAATPGTMEVVLDITLKKLEKLRPGDIEGLRRIFGELRPLKNRLFFGSLKPSTLRLFD